MCRALTRVVRPSPPDYEGFEWQTAETGRQRQAGALVDLENVAGQHDQSDLLVYWHTSDLALSGLKYPLSVIPMSAGVYYDIEIHLTANTVYHTSEIIEPFADISCGCGAAIERIEPRDDDPLHDERLPNNCPACREAIDYAVLPMTIRDGWTGVETAAVGGVTYRFAVVMDCGKCWPDQNQDAVVLPEFLSVIRQRLKTNTRVVRDFY